MTIGSKKVKTSKVKQEDIYNKDKLHGVIDDEGTEVNE